MARCGELGPVFRRDDTRWLGHHRGSFSTRNGLALEKRSLTIAGHRTSIALEPEFWSALEEICAARGVSLAAEIKAIDESRSAPNLSSAVRIAVLAYFRRSARD
jgi:predicted DNA-binding ribbon-helix-helix protein